MHLTLLAPGLLWPREILRDTTFDLPLPALSTLLGRGQRTALAGIDAWLAQSFALPIPLPAAPLRLLGDGGTPGDDVWLCLDPIHLRIDERGLTVAGPDHLALSVDEDAALRQAAATLLGEEPIAPVPGRWHLRLAEPAALETLPLDQAAGRPAAPDLPGGPDGPRWRRLLAEIQPLLHADAVNRRRDDQGMPMANSLWPWGCGRLPGTARNAFDRLCADDPVLRGLGRLAGIDTVPEPDRFETATGNTLVRYGRLAGPAAAFEAMAWREALAQLERDWLAPALAALRSGALRRLTLVAEGNGQTLEVAIGRCDLRRFWRQPLALAELTP